MNGITKFIIDFKKTDIFKSIIEDKNTNVLMIWLTGSTLTGIVDKESDYDLGVLVDIKPENMDHIYKRNTPYFAKYTCLNKKVQWIYNNVSDITSNKNLDLLDNIGWAQFKLLTDDFIVYINPIYRDFIESLLKNKDMIFSNSVRLLVDNIFKKLDFTCLHDVVYWYEDVPNKLLYHLCWIADVIEGTELDVETLLVIKRTAYIKLPDIYKLRIDRAIKSIETYLSNNNIVLNSFIPYRNTEGQNNNE